MRSSDYHSRRRRAREQPAYPEESPHDYNAAYITPADGEILVNAPHRQYYERWLQRQERPERFRYVYRIEQLRGIRDATVLAIGGGNTQLLTEEFRAYARHSNIEVKYLD